MHLHSTLDGRAGEVRLRGAAWELNPMKYRGFLSLIPAGDRGDGRYGVVEAEGETVWNLLDAVGQQVSSITGAPVKRLDARSTGPGQPGGKRRGSERGKRPDPTNPTH